MKPDTRIYDIRPKHAGELRRLFERAVYEDFNYFPEHYQKKVLRDNNLPHLIIAALKPSRIMLGASQSGKLIGYIISAINGNDTGKIYWLYVSPEGRGTGLGQSLLERTLTRMHHHGMRRVSLVTHDYLDYYSKFGFNLEKSENLYGVNMRVMSYSWPKS